MDGGDVGEDEREGPTGAAGAVRSQHIVLQGAPDARMIAAAIRPGIERSREVGEPGAPGCLVVTPTVEQAYLAARQARNLLADEQLRVVPVSAVARARRIVGAAPVAVVAGTATDLLALRRDSALRLSGVHSVVIVGLDEVLAEEGLETLLSLLADAPAEAVGAAPLPA
jgi:ATP-dependent RNA helicase DeaD